jgi:hypothetical protein
MYWQNYDINNAGAQRILDTADIEAGQVSQGYDALRTNLLQGYDSARDTYRREMDQSIGDIRSGGSAALGELAYGRALQGYSGQAGSQTQFGNISNQPMRLENTMDLYAGRQSALESLTGPGAARRFQASPGFQFSMDQATKGMERMQSARGGRLSAGAQLEMSKMQQGMASQEFNNWMAQQTALGSGIDQFRLQEAGQMLGASTNLDVNRQRGLLSQSEMELSAGEGMRNRAFSLTQLGVGAAGQSAGLQYDMGTGVANIRNQGGQYLSGMAVNRGREVGQSHVDMELADANIRTAGARDAANIMAGQAALGGQTAGNMANTFASMGQNASNTWSNVGQTVQNATSLYALGRMTGGGGGTTGSIPINTAYAATIPNTVDYDFSRVA